MIKCFQKTVNMLLMPEYITDDIKASSDDSNREDSDEENSDEEKLLIECLK